MSETNMNTPQGQPAGAPDGNAPKGPVPGPDFLRRMKFYEDTVACNRTDRILVAPYPLYLPILLYGETTIQDVMMDYTKFLPSLIRYQQEYDPDLYWGPEGIFPGAALDCLDCKFIKWPGRHMSDPNAAFQIIDQPEGYMTGEEYLEYAEDPTGFMMRKILPRHFGALQGLEMVDFSGAVWQGSVYSMIPFAFPPVQNAFKAMAEAGGKMLQMTQGTATIAQKMVELGWPSAIDYACQTPFDVFNDTLRGLLNTTMDMLEYPDELLEALKTSTKIQIRTIKKQCALNPFTKTVTFFVHNGMDMFMSVEQFQTFYWPGLKACIETVIEMGGIPHIYLEDKYDDKLDFFVNELPAGKCIITLINCDMEKAKEKFAGKICISGGVSGTLLQYGTPEDVVKDVKHAIDILAPGGGYFLDTDVSLDVAKPENLRVLYDTAKSYMKY